MISAEGAKLSGVRNRKISDEDCKWIVTLENLNVYECRRCKAFMLNLSGKRTEKEWQQIKTVLFYECKTGVKTLVFFMS